MKISARNLLKGKIASIEKGAVNSEVVLELDGGTPITTIITNKSVDNLAISVGSPAMAIIKATHVIIGTGDAKLSARNILAGKVAGIEVGAVNTEVSVEIGGGNVITAMITKKSAENLGLAKGSPAKAIVKASSIILAVD